MLDMFLSCRKTTLIAAAGTALVLIATAVAAPPLAGPSPVRAQETPTGTLTASATEEPTPEPTAEPTPEPTPEPADTPAPTSEATEEPSPSESPGATEEGDDDGIGAVGIVLIAGAVLLGIVLIAALLAASRRRKAVTGDWNSQLRASIGEARWIHATLSLDIANRATTRNPGELQRVWNEGQRRMSDLEASLFRLSGGAPEDRRNVPVSMLAEALGALRQALETDVALRADAAPQPGQDTLLAGSSAAISQRRGELATAIQALETATR